MNTVFLESFLQVVELGSMAEAARRLNLTPAAVAQRVKALEDELATPLLSRVGRIVRPTAAGHAVYNNAGAVLKALRELKDAALLDLVTGEQRLGAVSTAMTGILPGLLSTMSVQYPDVGFFVAPGTSKDLYQRVLTGDLDAAIIVQPPFPITKECDWRTMREERLIFIAAHGIDASDPARLLQSEPFLRYDRTHWGGQMADRYLHHCGIIPKDRFELDVFRRAILTPQTG